MNLNSFLSILAKNLIFVGLLSINCTSFSQSNTLVFEKKEIDMGKIKLNDISLQKFYYKSNLTTPIKIIEVITDCACATVNYSKKLISPEDSGFIEIKYEPYKPGHFNKSITVKTNGIPHKVELSIKGFVEPMYTLPKVEFPIKKGSLRFRNKAVNLGIVSNNGVIKKNIDIFNDEIYPITLKDKINAPEFIKINILSENTIIPPKQKGTITLYYNTEKLNDFGYFIDTVSFGTNDKQTSEVNIPVIATVKQHFSEDDLKSNTLPLLGIYPEKFSLGAISLKSDRILEFRISNYGKSDLVIHKIISNYGCEVGKLKNNVIVPNESREVSIKIYDTGRKGTQERSFLLFTNDPKNSIKKVVIKSKITSR